MRRNEVGCHLEPGGLIELRETRGRREEDRVRPMHRAALAPAELAGLSTCRLPSDEKVPHIETRAALACLKGATAAHFLLKWIHCRLSTTSSKIEHRPDVDPARRPNTEGRPYVEPYSFTHTLATFMQRTFFGHILGHILA